MLATPTGPAGHRRDRRDARDPQGRPGSASHAIKAGNETVPEAFVIADEARRMVEVLPFAAVPADVA
jgi:hypothetical protein